VRLWSLLALLTACDRVLGLQEKIDGPPPGREAGKSLDVGIRDLPGNSPQRASCECDGIAEPP
jgi:hypothetical protein